MSQTSSTIPEFCKRHNISKPTFYRQAKQGLMPRVVRLSPQIMRILPADEARWLASLDDVSTGA